MPRPTLRSHPPVSEVLPGRSPGAHTTTRQSAGMTDRDGSLGLRLLGPLALPAPRWQLPNHELPPGGGVNPHLPGGSCWRARGARAIRLLIGRFHPQLASVHGFFARLVLLHFDL